MAFDPFGVRLRGPGFSHAPEVSALDFFPGHPIFCFQHGPKNLPIPFGPALVRADPRGHRRDAPRDGAVSPGASKSRSVGLALSRGGSRRGISGKSGLFYGSRSRFTVWRQHMIARPDLVIVTGKKSHEAMTRDLAVTRMADLCLQDCTGLTPAVLTVISGIDFHRLTPSTGPRVRPIVRRVVGALRAAGTNPLGGSGSHGPSPHAYPCRGPATVIGASPGAGTVPTKRSFGGACGVPKALRSGPDGR
jgi:hypothetical protein